MFFCDGYAAATARQWVTRSLCAAVAFGEACGGSEIGWSKSHGGTVPGGPSGWSVWAAGFAAAANDMTAGDNAAINATASRATIFAFISFPTGPYPLSKYKSRFLKAVQDVVVRTLSTSGSVRRWKGQSEAIRRSLLISFED